MDIETKKNEKGEEILEITSGYATGTEVNLSELINYLGDSIAWNEISTELTGLAMRYSINLLRLPIECEEMQNEAIKDLMTIENLVSAFSKSIKSPRITNSDLEMTKEAYLKRLESEKELMHMIVTEKEDIIADQKRTIKSLKKWISEKDEHIQELKDRISDIQTNLKDQ